MINLTKKKTSIDLQLIVIHYNFKKISASLKMIFVKKTTEMEWKKVSSCFNQHKHILFYKHNLTSLGVSQNILGKLGQYHGC